MPSTSSESSSDTTTSPLSTRPSLAVNIIDGMAELQSLDIPEWVHNCAHLADHFIATLDLKYETTKEVRLVFDRYDIATSLKEATREKRQAGLDPIYYRITDSTLITKVPMKRLLSHPKTKMELTIYLAGKTLEHAQQSTRPFVVAWGGQCRATHKDVEHLPSNREEADTKMILHAVDATSDGVTEIKIHSPDTDVLVLDLRRYPMLCVDASFVTGRGHNHREIKMGPIVQALGPTRTAALPAFSQGET